ncbi:MAG: ectonucleotide pyrophosphatase/phosphodiesterase [Eubacteriales bacterium]|nr:ectonucleotide pyrophosphatase/phosphodiesterase [Eubacteriales bacterium]
MRLVLISMDAASRLDAEKLLRLPNLSKMAENGVLCTNVSTVYPTLTYPIHASIISGCYPDRHGIAHNELFDENPPQYRPWYWEADRIKVPTLFTAANAAGRDSAALLWPTTGKAKFIGYNMPEILAFPWENQVLKVLKYGSTWELIKSELKYGKQRKSNKQPHLDSFVTLLATKLIERQYSRQIEKQAEVSYSSRQRRKHMPDFMAIHLVELDAMRHEFGVDSTESESALRHLDYNIGLILQSLSMRDLLRDTLVCVVSDHGHENVYESVNLNAILKHYSVPARAQSLGFGAYFHTERADRTLVYNHLVQHMDEYKIAHVYSNQELRSLRAPENIQIACEMQEGVEALDTDKSPKHKATHGFSLKSPSAKTLFWLMGPNIKRGVELDSMDIVDIAPTLAYASGLSLTGTDGKLLNNIFID